MAAIDREGARIGEGPGGAFTLEARLGEGGFGVVWRAVSEAGQKVAVKIAKLPSSSLSTEQIVLQQNEIEVLRKLKHPSLVEILGHGFLPDERLYLVMELIEGQLLAEHLRRRKRLEPIEAISLVRKISEALAYCH